MDHQPGFRNPAHGYCRLSFWRGDGVLCCQRILGLVSPAGEGADSVYRRNRREAARRHTSLYALRDSSAPSLHVAAQGTRTAKNIRNATTRRRQRNVVSFSGNSSCLRRFLVVKVGTRASFLADPVRDPVQCVRGKRETMDRKSHWQRVYETKAPDAVSWFQSAPTVSARLLESAGLGPGT